MRFSMSNANTLAGLRQPCATVHPINARVTRRPLSQRANPDIAFRLPFVCRREDGTGGTARIDWWHVQPSDYYHQNEEIGRVFCEEVFRRYPEDPESIENAL